MGLSYYFTFTAPAETTAEELMAFLKRVEKDAQGMGFRPTLVLDAAFDTPERRSFARRLTTGLPLQDERLKGVALPSDAAVWEHDPRDGSCHLLPSRGVVLVVTDEAGCETIFGFFRYPQSVKDIHGKILAETGLGGRWYFRDFVDSPNPRFRRIVEKFREAGFLENAVDDYGRVGADS
jgi:hypothetical protein